MFCGEWQKSMRWIGESKIHVYTLCILFFVLCCYFLSVGLSKAHFNFIFHSLSLFSWFFYCWSTLINVVRWGYLLNKCLLILLIEYFNGFLFMSINLYVSSDFWWKFSFWPLRVSIQFFVLFFYSRFWCQNVKRLK